MRKEAGRRLASTAVLTGALALLGAAPAMAAVEISQISPDPAVEEGTFQVHFDVTAEAGDGLFLEYKRTGGQGCASEPGVDDDSERVEVGPIVSYDAGGPDEPVQDVAIQESGSYVLCAWLGQDGSYEPDAFPVTVRQPVSTASFAVPPTVRPGEAFPLEITAQAEISRVVFVDVNPPGVPCGPNADANEEAQTVLFDGGWPAFDVYGGPLEKSENVTAPDEPGAYPLCGYVQESASDAVPETKFTGDLAVALPSGNPKVAIGAKRLTVSRRSRKGRLSVKCRNIAADRCKIDLKVMRGKRSIARIRGTVAGGKSKRLAVKLKRSALRPGKVRLVGASVNRAGGRVAVSKRLRLRVKR